jgi:LPXTG-site transpeptidase (sortase) family protein
MPARLYRCKLWIEAREARPPLIKLARILIIKTLRKILFLGIPIIIFGFFALRHNLDSLSQEPQPAAPALSAVVEVEEKPVAMAEQAVPPAKPLPAEVATVSEQPSLHPSENYFRIRIPSIDINASVEPMGLTPAGAMDAPKGPDEAGWYKYGPEPGEVGSAVIDGHSGWKNDIPAVFDNLGNVKAGDKIYIEDSKGVVSTFVVRELREYGYNADPSEIFHSKDGLSHLNLITCAGQWNDISRSSSLRLVVFADKL